jgi:HAMP domain-containing protein
MERRSWRILGALVLIQLLGQLLHFLCSAEGLGDIEELYTAFTALLMLDGFASDWSQYQYFEFCGGCSLDAGIATIPYAIVGPSLFLWKFIPWGWAALILAAGSLVVHRVGGSQASWLYGLWILLAPTYYITISMIGWNNHMEVMGLVLLGVLSWDETLRVGSKRLALLTGFLWGLGFWYCYTSAFAPPTLLLLWAILKPREILRRIPLALLGGLVGMIPWFWSRLATSSGLPALSVYDASAEGMISLANIPYRLANFGAPFWHSAYLPALARERPLPGALLLAVMGVAVLAAAAFAARAVARRTARPLDLALPALAMAFVAAYLLVKPPGPAGEVLALHQSADLMRYLVPLVPLTGLCAAVALPRLGLPGRGLLMAVLALGFTARLCNLDITRFSARPLSLPGAEPGFAVGRFGHVHFEEQDDGLIWLSELHPLVRRPFLVGAGNRLTEAVIRGDDGGGWGRLVTLAESLEPPERRSLLTAAVETLHGQGGAPGSPRRAELDASIAALPDSIRCDLMLESARFGLPEPLRDPATLREALHAEAEPPHDPCLLRAMAWHVGRAALNEGFIGQDEQLGRARAVMAQVSMDATQIPQRHRGAFYEGAGERAGEIWGYSASAWRTQRGQLPEQGRSAFDLGFERGAQWTFLWPASAPEGP